MALAQSIRNALSIPELRKRLLFTAGVLLIFRVGSFVPIPGASVRAAQRLFDQMRDDLGYIMGFLSVIGGGLDQLSIFSLGIAPYISASIIFQLLIKVLPALEKLSEEGPSGMRKINQFTRLATVPIALIQSIFVYQLLKNYYGGTFILEQFLNSWWVPYVGVASFTAGAMFVMWLGEQISEYGIGNGASVIIMVGIIDRMPFAFQYAWKELSNTPTKLLTHFGLLGVIFVAVVIGIVYITQAQRRIPIQQAKHTRGRRVYGGARHYVPLRVNQAGVMPVIFASSLLVVPALVGRAFDGVIPGSSEFFRRIFQGDTFFYVTLYVGLIFFFSYFWTSLMFQPVQMADNLKNWGSFIPGIRSGRRTAEYLDGIMVRVTLVGAAFLCVIALLPNLLSYQLGMEQYLTGFLGGTGILIVVGVALDVVQKIESHLLVRHYEGFMKKGRVRGRR